MKPMEDAGDEPGTSIIYKDAQCHQDGGKTFSHHALAAAREPGGILTEPLNVAGAKSPCSVPPGCVEPKPLAGSHISRDAIRKDGANSFSGEAGSPQPCYPRSREDWLAALETCNSMVKMGKMLAGGFTLGFAVELSTCAEPRRLSHLKVKSGELFPLPVFSTCRG